MYKHIYGPVPSRRLGISLGIDLVPHKVCSYNCVYCECGPNTLLTLKREEYVPVREVLEEIRDFLKSQPAPDYLTLSGSGEPALNSGMGSLIRSLKTEFPDVKVAVLTNGSLLDNSAVRSDMMEADLVLPNLDAATEEAFRKIDRPHAKISLRKVLDGLSAFAKEFRARDPRKELWLEVFILEGVNTDRENVDALRDACREIRPDRIQLNTLDRPGTENWVHPASWETLERIREELNLPNVEIISRFRNKSELKTYKLDIEETILDTLSRRPSTAEDLSHVLGIRIAELNKYLDILTNDKRILAEVGQSKSMRGVFYRLVRE